MFRVCLVDATLVDATLSVFSLFVCGGPCRHLDGLDVLELSVQLHQPDTDPDQDLQQTRGVLRLLNRLQQLSDLGVSTCVSKPS